ncbi:MULTISPECIES: class I SAM-dependent methyltransferase [Aliiglaciecola]|uniref:class I SAM-dependent methyltransferase n=1 Tax=Aliiglaciecola TaxID=1406885 RepID=UPI001C09EEB2|nr:MULTISPECIES: class I SAM-dependent methyltransferase [Aliiglaciecola]MBU2880123.1 class I SAM-dependent methyltransferase [Aliiglaciecola lipolytica]MDO6710879.1 class I SAM-dependent methyltransferase [Aliiglaciecola sp. 2_MG-2023]MDO6752360.1 class I SAM-dependent methyltransferase [Aliiglaciecola sp. 1_MG-2023]
MQTTEEFAGQVVTDVSATLSGVMTSLGHKLGLYEAMAYSGPYTSISLSEKLGLAERYVREWLNNQVAGQYIVYDKTNKTYQLPDAHVPVLADPESPVFLVPALEVAASLWHDEDLLKNVFKTGEGISWGAHHHRLFCGSESLFRPGYKSFLINDWLSAMDGVITKLQEGALVADVGCGHGASTIVMANAFRQSKFYGFDNHLESIKTATDRASSEPAQSNTFFETIDAQSYPSIGFDLICFMDCLHDMGDPVGAAQHALKSLKPGSSLLLVEPAAGDAVEENINPVSRLYYAASTAVCTPCSLSQDVGLALGAQAGQKRLSEVLEEAGFVNVKKIADTPFNIVIQANRPD